MKGKTSGKILLWTLLVMLIIAIPMATVASYADETVAAVRTKSNGNPYYIMVNRQMNTVTVYTLDSKGYYSVPYKAMVCSCGRSGHATPTGTYKTPNSRYTWRLMVDGSYGQYASRITGSILFHSACYTRTSPSALMTEEYDMLGNHASLGCVRLQVADAKWIYDHCGTGTYVTIYDSSNPGALGKPQKAVDSISSSPYKKWDPTDPATGNPWRFQISATAEGPGTVTGGGAFRYGETVAMTAQPEGEARFDGWYDANGNLVSTDLTLRRSVERETSCTAKFTQMVSVGVSASRSGSAGGGGIYPVWSDVTVNAYASGTKAFLGWYEENGQKVADTASYRFSAIWNRMLYAMFEGDVFGDIPSDAWYLKDAMRAYEEGITKGLSEVCFGPDVSFTRAMAVQMLARMDAQLPSSGNDGIETPDIGTDTGSDGRISGETTSGTERSGENSGNGAGTVMDDILLPEAGSEPAGDGEPDGRKENTAVFSDVAEDAWYADAVAWAAGQGLVNGVGDGLFAPEVTICRADMITLLGRYLNSRRSLPELTDEVLPYGDEGEIPAYARKWFCIGTEIGLIRGYDDNTVRPGRTLTRAEGATLMMRTKDVL